MMNVKVDHGDPLQPFILNSMQRRDGRCAEQAKAHRPDLLGMVSGGPMRTKSVYGLARQHAIHGVARPTHGTQRRFHRTGTDPSISIQRLHPLGRGGILDRIDIGLGMRQQQMGIGAKGRLVSRETVETRVTERFGQRAHTVGPLRMTVRHVMIEIGLVAVKKCAHDASMEPPRLSCKSDFAAS